MSEIVDCPYCGEKVERKYIFECPECLREGCEKCMPAGRNCLCPECEEKEDE